ncbi:rhamnan synthesis F family protein (plasmid) [Sphingomonas sp. NY01]|uniref:rhamnan synthesis F family protein n=1 Tax=Sphingomonas sp. NY01 TaxID=2968057 RepID=UPI00315D5080
MARQSSLARLRPLVRQLYWAVTPAVHGRARPSDVPDASAAVPFAYDVGLPASDPRICVVCHLFYDDLAAEMREVLSHIPFGFDLFVSTSSEGKRDRIASVFADFGKGQVDVRISPNRGRDIAPKLVTFAGVYDRYDYVLFVHGKKSAKSSVGEQWRDLLIAGLVGSADTVRSIIAMMERHPSIGIVMAQHFEPIRPHLHWDHSFARARRLARRMGVDLSRRHVLDMPSGSMFWARTAALAPLLALGLRSEDFPVEKGQTRRTLHHTIERLFLFAAERAGFRWVKVAAPGHYSAHTAIETITGPTVLDAFIKKNSFRLTDSHHR